LPFSDAEYEDVGHFDKSIYLILLFFVGAAFIAIAPFLKNPGMVYVISAAGGAMMIAIIIEYTLSVKNIDESSKMTRRENENKI